MDAVSGYSFIKTDGNRKMGGEQDQKVRNTREIQGTLELIGRNST